MNRKRFSSTLLLASLAACSARDPRSVKVRDPVAAILPDAPPRETEPFASVEPPELEAASEAGTFADATRLVYSHVNASVRGGSVTVRVVDVVSNDGPAPLDFAYTFPLPGDATLSELAYFQNGKRIRAAAQEKTSARAHFEAAKARGESAALSEASGNSRFSVAMSQLMPGESRRIELSYVQGLESFGAKRSFNFPAAHSERRGEPTLDFEVSVESEHELEHFASVNHPDARLVKLGSNRSRVLLNRTASSLGQDLVVRWSERSEPIELALRAVAGQGKDPGFAEFDFAFNADRFQNELPPRDFVFVVDTSLSMAGEALTHAKLLVERCLEQLGPKDRLALVAFDDALSSWGELTRASLQTKERALSELGPKRASGFSNVEAAIDRAHDLIAGSPNATVVLISDGQSTVGKEPEKLMPASQASDFKDARVFVALTNYPSRRRELERLFPNATLRFLPSGDAGREAARALSSLIAAPMLEDIHVTLEGLSVDERYGATPTRLPLGERIRLLGRLSGGSLKATVGAKLHGRALNFEKSATASPRESDRASLPREWARAKLSSLEDRYAENPNPALKTQAIELGKQFGLVSSFTSLVASDSLSPDRIAPGDPELRIRAPRSESAVTAVLPWGDEVHCHFSEQEGLWLGRFLVPRHVKEGLQRVTVFSETQGRARKRSTLLLRVDSRAPSYRLELEPSDAGLLLTALPLRDVFDKSGDSLRLDLVDVKSVDVEVDGKVYALQQAEAGRFQTRIEPPAAGEHRVAWVATDYARNSSRSVAKLTVAEDGRTARVSGATTSSTSAEPATPSASPPLAEQTVNGARCWFGQSSRRATLQRGETRVELFDEFLRVNGAELTPCNGLPKPHPVAITTHQDGIVVAFRDGSRSLYRTGTFEAAPPLTRAEEEALAPPSRPTKQSRAVAGELPSAHIAALATFQNRLMVGTFDGGMFALKPDASLEKLPGAPHFVNALLPVGDTLWIGGATGLFAFEAGHFREVPLGIAASHVNGLAQSRDGWLWLATSDGLLGFRAGVWRKLDEHQGLPSRIAYAVTESADGALWVGTASGVARIAKDGVQRFGVETGALPHRWVTALLAEGNGVWVGTYQGGATFVDPSGARALRESASLWLNPHGLRRFDERMYAASLGGGLVEFGQQQPAKRLAPLPSDDVTAVERFAGALWIGTRAGLVRLPR